MLKKRSLTIIVIISIVIALITLLVGTKTIIEWFISDWKNILYATVVAIVLAIAAAIIIKYFEPKSITKRRTHKKDGRPVLARLILPNNIEIRITEDNNIFKKVWKWLLSLLRLRITEVIKILKREDFQVGCSLDDLLDISRKHFKIIRMDDVFYIEDLESKNGTKLNGEEIKGKGRKRLKDVDGIEVGEVLKVRYKL